jgi:hypothetical protein
MKKIALLALTFLSCNVFANTLDVTATYEIITVDAACRANCVVDETTGVNNCRYQIYFEQASFDQINTLKNQYGFRDTWFPRSPKEICEAKELPEYGKGYAPIKVMVYGLDLSKFNEQF